MSHKNSKANSGFTIIEVLIVLAIAGLILLIVFLAVPALQRTSRNTQIKKDAQSVLGGAAEYQGANNGKMPGSVSGNGTVTYAPSSGNTGTNTSIDVQGSTEVTTVTTAPTSPPTPGSIQVKLGTKCNGGVSSRAISVYYSIETSSATPTLQCTDS